MQQALIAIKIVEEVVTWKYLVWLHYNQSVADKAQTNLTRSALREYLAESRDRESHHSKRLMLDTLHRDCRPRLSYAGQNWPAVILATQLRKPSVNGTNVNSNLRDEVASRSLDCHSMSEERRCGRSIFF